MNGLAGCKWVFIASAANVAIKIIFRVVLYLQQKLRWFEIAGNSIGKTAIVINAVFFYSICSVKNNNRKGQSLYKKLY